MKIEIVRKDWALVAKIRKRPLEQIIAFLWNNLVAGAMMVVAVVLQNPYLAILFLVALFLKLDPTVIVVAPKPEAKEAPKPVEAPTEAKTSVPI